MKIRSKTLLIKGSQKFVKDYLSMSTGGNRNLESTTKTAVRGQSAILSSGNVLGAFISTGFDAITALADCLLGIITVSRVLATGIGSFLYNLLAMIGKKFG